MYVHDENIWETGGESVIDESVCVCVCETEALATRMSERESRSSDENVKFTDVKAQLSHTTYLHGDF